MTRQMAMVGFLQAQNCTNLPSSWRHPESRDDSMSAHYYQEIAGVLEAGKFHMAFFDDRSSALSRSSRACRTAASCYRPMSRLPLIATSLSRSRRGTICRRCNNIRPFVTAGGLMSYGVDFTDVFRQAASVRRV